MLSEYTESKILEVLFQNLFNQLYQLLFERKRVKGEFYEVGSVFRRLDMDLKPGFYLKVGSGSTQPESATLAVFESGLNEI